MTISYLSAPKIITGSTATGLKAKKPVLTVPKLEKLHTSELVFQSREIFYDKLFTNIHMY